MRSVTRINKPEQTAVQKGAKRSKVTQWRKLSYHHTSLTTAQGVLRNEQTGCVGLH